MSVVKSAGDDKISREIFETHFAKYKHLWILGNW